MYIQTKFNVFMEVLVGLIKKLHRIQESIDSWNIKSKCHFTSSLSSCTDPINQTGNGSACSCWTALACFPLSIYSNSCGSWSQTADYSKNTGNT